MLEHVTNARVVLEGLSNLTQTKFHEEPKLKGELADAYNRRVFKQHLHVTDGFVSIPETAFMQCLASAAKYSKKQIPGQGKATWTAKFQAGIMIFPPCIVSSDDGTKMTPDNVSYVDIFANVDGIRGSNKRVMRRYPTILRGWRTTFDVAILDPIVTEDVFREMLKIAGMFVGIGQFRPEKGGTNGRFKIAELVWEDKREKIKNKSGK